MIMVLYKYDSLRRAMLDVYILSPCGSPYTESLFCSIPQLRHRVRVGVVCQVVCYRPGQ